MEPTSNPFITTLLLFSIISPTAYLLPNYDEYFIGYKTSTDVFDGANLNRLIFPHIIVLNGRIIGTWRRTFKKSTVVIETNIFTRPTKAETKAIAAAAHQYGEFLGLPAVLA